MTYTVTRIGRRKFALTSSRHVCDGIYEECGLGIYPTEEAAWKAAGF